jgi:hypothetical protein
MLRDRHLLSHTSGLTYDFSAPGLQKNLKSVGEDVEFSVFVEILPSGKACRSQYVCSTHTSGSQHILMIAATCRTSDLSSLSQAKDGCMESDRIGLA